MSPIALVLIIVLVLILIFVFKVDFKWAAITGGILVLLSQNEKEKDVEEQIENAEEKIKRLEKENTENKQEITDAKAAIECLDNEHLRKAANLDKDQAKERQDSIQREIGNREGAIAKNEEKIKKLQEKYAKKNPSPESEPIPGSSPESEPTPGS